MDYELTKKELLKQARNAFEIASTLRDNQRIEVYLDNDVAKISDTLEESDEIIYNDKKILCYEIYGYDYLEDEIKTWIDYARILQQPTDETPLQEPTDIEISIRELLDEIAKKSGVAKEMVDSYEIFANLPMDLLGSIEQKIFEYWWDAPEEENGKKLAILQIEAALNI
jgi:S-adenosylmethionine:tRNA-ribosyltransferase-isomerase (queuine synthetase)